MLCNKPTRSALQNAHVLFLVHAHVSVGLAAALFLLLPDALLECTEVFFFCTSLCISLQRSEVGVR